MLIGFPRYLARLVDISNYAHARGIKIITITDSPLTPFKADVRLSAPITFVYFFWLSIRAVNPCQYAARNIDP